MAPLHDGFLILDLLFPSFFFLHAFFLCATPIYADSPFPIYFTDYPTAKPPQSVDYLPRQLQLSNGRIRVYPILYRMSPSGPGVSFAAGFYCINPCKTYIFSVFFVGVNSAGNPVYSDPTPVVWSANRAHPVSDTATLRLTSDSGLTLIEGDGTIVWSTSLRNQSVAGINITESGNLVIFDTNNHTIRQSFDHPTDTLLLGQAMAVGARLVANVSYTNWSESRVHLTLTENGLRAFVNSNPPQLYYNLDYTISNNITENKSGYLKLTNGSLDMFSSILKPGMPDQRIPLQNASSLQYIRLESDGHLRLYDYSDMIYDALDGYVTPPDCGYPTVCGYYGICQKGECICPNTTYFQVQTNPEFHFCCSPLTPITCQDTTRHSLLSLGNIAYFNFLDCNGAAFSEIDEESCKKACLQNCSCKAAFFLYSMGGQSTHKCYLPSEVFSLEDNQLTPSLSDYFNSSAYLKVQLPSPLPSPGIFAKSPDPSSFETTRPLEISRKTGLGLGTIIVSSLGGLFLLLLTVGISLVFLAARSTSQI